MRISSAAVRRAIVTVANFQGEIALPGQGD
jgi:hypothetical protein